MGKRRKRSLSPRFQRVYEEKGLTFLTFEFALKVKERHKLGRCVLLQSPRDGLRGHIVYRVQPASLPIPRGWWRLVRSGGTLYWVG